MFFLAHLGITVAGGVAASRITCYLGRIESAGPLVWSEHAESESEASCESAYHGRLAASQDFIHDLPRQLDYRLIAVGSVLPDVDKFIGMEVFGRFDRSIFHTLLWFAALVAASVLLYRRARDTRGLQLAGCWAMHLALDAMWTDPRLLLWPFLGSMPPGGEFGLPEFEIYAEHALLTDWHQYAPELIGLAVVLGMALPLLRRGSLGQFLRTGRTTVTTVRSHRS